VFSVAGHRVPRKEISFYSATKYAVTALTEGLRLELAEAKSHIRISVTQSCKFVFISRVKEVMLASVECMVYQQQQHS